MANIIISEKNSSHVFSHNVKICVYSTKYSIHIDTTPEELFDALLMQEKGKHYVTSPVSRETRKKGAAPRDPERTSSPDDTVRSAEGI